MQSHNLFKMPRNTSTYLELKHLMRCIAGFNSLTNSNSNVFTIDQSKIVKYSIYSAPIQLEN